jgi:Fe-S cluster assembly iron-binding protein IscA
MLKITRKAVDRMQNTLRAVAETADDCLRIVITEEGPELIVDQERPGDETLFRDDKLLLAIDSATLQTFDERTLEVDDAQNSLVLC